MTRSKVGKINVRLIVILVVAFVALGMAAVAARHVGRRILSQRALRLGREAVAGADWAEACRQFRDYLGRDPDDTEVLLAYAEACVLVRPIEWRNVQRAAVAYRRVIELAPTETLPYERLAGLYAGLKQYAELRYLAQKRIEHVPDDLRARVWLAEALVELRKPDEADAVLDEIIAACEDDDVKRREYVQACFLKGGILAETGTGDARRRAEAWLDRAVAYDPSSAEALLYRARFLRNDGRPAEARRDLEQADGLGIDDLRVRLMLCDAWLAQGDVDRAAAQLDRVRDVDDATIREYFPDINDWMAQRFVRTARVALAQGGESPYAREALALMEGFQDRRHRRLALPYGIRILLAAGRPAEAEARLDDYLALRSTGDQGTVSTANVAHLEALVARAQERPYQVIDVLEPILVSETDRADLWKLVAEAYSRTDQIHRAVESLDTYIKLRPRDVDAKLQLTREYLKLRDWNSALATARLAESLDPTDIVLTLLRIESSVYLAVEQQERIDSERLDTLAAELADLRQSHPDQVGVRILQSVIAGHRGDDAEAERELKLAIVECDQTLRAEMQLARHYYRLKRMDDAIEVCRAACDRHSDIAEPWLSLARLYVVEKDIDQARASLAEGLAHTENRWERRDLTLHLAVLELVHGERAAGVTLLKDLAAGNPNEIRARSMLLNLREVREEVAWADELVDQIRQAEGATGLRWRLHQASLRLARDDWRSRQQEIHDALRYCIDHDPNWSAPVLLLAELYRKLGELDDAEQVCRQALSRNPASVEVADRLITLLEKQNRFDDAREVLARMNLTGRTAGDWQIRLALHAGDFSRAIQNLKLRVSNDDRDLDARVLLARLLYWETRDAEEAFVYLRQAEAIDPTAMAVVAAKATILRAENRIEETLAVLDDYVADRGDFNAYLMRAAFLAGMDRDEAALRDLRKLTGFDEHGPRGWEVLAAFHIDRGRLDDAVAALEKGLRAHPEDLALRRGLMRLLFARPGEEDRARALNLLAQLERQFPDDPELMRLRARVLMAEGGASSAARANLERAVQVEPTSVGGQLDLIGLLMAQGEYQEAKATAIRALSVNPGHETLLLARARAELALDNTALAADLARRILDENDASADAAGILGQAALADGDPATMEAALAVVTPLATVPDAPEPLCILQAELLAARERFDDAIATLKRYGRSDAGARSVRAWLTLGELLRHTGQLDDAEAALGRAEQLAPADPRTARLRVLLLGTRGRYDAIPAAVAAWTDETGAQADLLITAASVLAASSDPGDRDQARALADKIAAASPEAVDAQLGLAALQYQLGRADLAVQAYRRILRAAPATTRALNDLAWILAERDPTDDEALDLANAGLRLRPGDANLLDTRGTIRLGRGRPSEAKADFLRLVDTTSPDTPARARALVQLARACADLDEAAAVRRYLDEALRIDAARRVFDDAVRAEIRRMLASP